MTLSDIINDKDYLRLSMYIEDNEAYVDYHFNGDTMYLTHSEVPYQMRGQGIGQKLVEKTFEYIAANNINAVAVCSYIKNIRQRNGKWKKLIGQ
jgi:predicted GNAT family acetyltransferase